MPTLVCAGTNTLAYLLGQWRAEESNMGREPGVCGWVGSAAAGRNGMVTGFPEIKVPRLLNTPTGSVNVVL